MKTPFKKQIEKCADCEHCDTGITDPDKFFCLAMNKQTCPYDVLPKWCPLTDYNDKAESAELLAALENIAEFTPLSGEVAANFQEIARGAIAKHNAGKEG